MTHPLPGQRAGQQPMRAAVQAQRAIGRAVTFTGAMSGQLILYVNGEWMRHAVDEETGRDRLEPYALDSEQPEEGADDGR
ncbi:hypothetical protein [Streptomyces sp. NPDC049879]|uniref:hypothetical protein n=1 Tax=Streptomyces sp. NPDC049879 TaxID=3365598 RepID=UPI0037B918C5